MTIEEKLEQRLEAQGWDEVTVDPLMGTSCELDHPAGFTEHYYRHPFPLDAEKATQIEEWFRERLSK